MYSLRSLIRGLVSLEPSKKLTFGELLTWLGKEVDYGTFYSTEHDPNFNIEEVKELLKEDQEADNAQ